MDTFLLWWHRSQNQSNYKKQLSVLTRCSGRILLEKLPVSYILLIINIVVPKNSSLPRMPPPLLLAGDNDFASLKKMQKKCADGKVDQTHNMIYSCVKFKE